MNFNVAHWKHLKIYQNIYHCFWTSKFTIGTIRTVSMFERYNIRWFGLFRTVKFVCASPKIFVHQQPPLCLKWLFQVHGHRINHFKSYIRNLKIPIHVLCFFVFLGLTVNRSERAHVQCGGIGDRNTFRFSFVFHLATTAHLSKYSLVPKNVVLFLNSIFFICISRCHYCLFRVKSGGSNQKKKQNNNEIITKTQNRKAEWKKNKVPKMEKRQ